jgi:Domain of unknown function (DUF5916)/Carbohydrate family 9 binding domain-like
MNRVEVQCVALAALSGMLCFALAPSASAQASLDSGPSVSVTRVERAPVIDGNLDEPEWQQAGVIRDLVQIRPGDGEPMSEKTEVYLMYDKDALYVAARMWDAGSPDELSATVMKQNSTFGNDDRIAVIIDPFNTGRNGYRFEVNANAVRNDMLYQGGQMQSEWSVIWDAAATVGEGEWIAEFAIPFKSLPFDASIEDWGFNVSRAIRRRGEEAVWVSRNRQISPSIVGLATGFKELDKGIGLDVVPGVAVTHRQTHATSTSETDTEPSLDLFYRITPALTGSLTFNTDFSATEVDDRQVNLTRFNLFYPEKRDFFLADADLFDFGRYGGSVYPPGIRSVSNASQQNGRPFFSRRIGLSSLGTPVDIDYGGKLSGRVGRYTFGAMGIRQDEFVPPVGVALDPTSLFVGRVTMDVLSQSSLGVIGTAGNPQGLADNSLVGADFQYNNNRLPWGRPVQGEVWFQQSQTENREGDDHALGVGFRIPASTGWRGGFMYKELGRNFFPALGFVNRVGIRDEWAGFGYVKRFTGGALLTSTTEIDAQQISSLETGQRLTEIFAVRAVELETQGRDLFKIYGMDTKDRLLVPFLIYNTPGSQVIIPVGDYRFAEYGVNVETGAQRVFSAKLNFRGGEFYDGDRTNWGGEFSWKPSRHFNLSGGYDWNKIELPYGSFITRLSRLTTEINFTSNLNWINLAQYDDVSEVFGMQSRLQWIPQAGREFFLVVNRNYEDFNKDNSFSPVITDVTVKGTYTFRF